MFNNLNGVDVVEILLHPNNTQGNQNRMNRVKKDMDDRDGKELTLRPKTLSKKNFELLQNNQSMTGDHNQDLYYKSMQHEKRNKESEEYWYERAQNECTFQPKINKKPISVDLTAPGDVSQIRGIDKQMARLKKAREDAEFKKRMTERSNFSATNGVKKARK